MNHRIMTHFEIIPVVAFLLLQPDREVLHSNPRLAPISGNGRAGLILAASIILVDAIDTYDTRCWVFGLLFVRHADGDSSRSSYLVFRSDNTLQYPSTYNGKLRIHPVNSKEKFTTKS
jgi:hypothetical protein